MDAQVLECLRATLSPHEAARRAAEEQLKELFLHPEGGLSLARVLLNQDVELPQRQSAGVLLQKYIDQHWSFTSSNAQQPPTGLEVKAQTRPTVFRGLSDPQRKIRSASAFAISTIARHDWPDEYPDLLSNLVVLLKTGSSNSVHGAMRVITEFVKNDLSEDQLLPVVQGLVPALLSILANHQTHSPSTRASTIQVFRQVIKMLETVRDEHPQAVRQALDSLSPAWFGAFRTLLAAEAAEELRASWESLALRIEIFRTLLTMQTAFPRVIASDLPTYLQLAVRNLVSLVPTFHAYYLSTSPEAPEPPSPSSDVGFMAPKLDIDDLGCTIFDFLTPVVRTQRAVDSLVDMRAGKGSSLMEEMLRVALEYTQVTRANEEEWLENANAFVQGEDEETEVYGLRTVGHDLIGSLIDKWPRFVGKILQDLSHQKVQESAGLRSAGSPDWWKPLEAVLALLGDIADDIRNVLEDDVVTQRPPTLDMPYLFDQVIPNLLDQIDTPFLQGRAFVFSSQFASSLPAESASRYLEAAVTVLQSSSVSVPVKISAVKTVKNFCRFINVDIMQPQSGKLLGLLLPLLRETTNETLYLLLETVQAILALDKGLLKPESTQEVAERVYEVWYKHSTDPVLTAIVEELCESIISSSSPAAVRTLVMTFSPRLAVVISSPVTDDTVHLPGEAIQLANALLRGRGGPIEPELVGSVSAAVMGILRTTDDMDVIQHGMIHLTLIVRKDCDKLVHWHNHDGINGIETIFHLLARLLDPSFSESGGIFVGELIMHLFRKAGGSIGPVLPGLLRAVVQRLATAQMPSFIQSLVLPFAYLFGTEHTQSTLGLLSQFNVEILDGSSVSGLEVVLAAWCETSDAITGSWNIRVSGLGMSKLFAMNDERLRNIIVKGDLIISDTNRDTIMTRSRTKITPNQYTQIPFPVKAFKLLLKDLQMVEGEKGNRPAVDDIAEDDGNDQWDDDDPLGNVDEVGEFDYLSSWMDAGKVDDTQDDDEDLRADPMAQVDMAEHLTGVLRGCYGDNSSGVHEMVAALTDEEKGILRRVLTM